MNDQPESLVASEVESLLLRAQTEPAARNAFYLALLDAEVLAVVYAEEERPDDSARVVTFATLTLDGAVLVPFATSRAIFSDAFPGKTPVTLKGIDLLKNASPKNLLMNPGTPFAKTFSPQEVDYILSLVQDTGAVASVKLEPGAKISLGEPKMYPQSLVQKLKDFLPQLPQVRRAWIAQSLIDQDDASANLMLGLDLDGDVNAVMPKLGRFVSPLIPAGTAFDMALVESSQPHNNITRYFLNESTPFYVAEPSSTAVTKPKSGFRKFFGL